MPMRKPEVNVHVRTPEVKRARERRTCRRLRVISCHKGLGLSYLSMIRLRQTEG